MPGEEGKLPRFEVLGYTGDAMRVNGYRYPIVIDLAGADVERQVIPALRSHDADRIVGQTDDIRVDQEGIHFAGDVSGTGADASEIVANAKNGFRWQASVGAKPKPGMVEHLKAGKKMVVNGREFKGPKSIIRGSTFHEISLLALGADSNTTAAIAATTAGAERQMDPKLKDWLDDKGIEAANVDDSMIPVFEAQLKAEKATVTEEKEPVDIQATVAKAVADAVAGTVEKIEAQHAHRDLIRTITDGHPEIQAKAIADNWTTDKAELEVERASRPRPIMASTGVDGAPDSAQVIEAALTMNAGMQDEELGKHFDEKVIDAAKSSRFRGFGIHALMYDVIRAAGMSYTPGVVNNGFIRTAFEADQKIQASGISNASLSGVLSNSANKFIVAGFNSTEQAWRRIAHTKPVRDFKTVTGYRLTGDFTYEQLNPNGELKHAEMGETSYTNQAKTYGKIFSLDRTTLINDDLDAIEQTARVRLGRGAGLKLNNVFWTEFLNNSSFFTSGNGSYFEGAATNLQVSSLTTAVQKFRDQKDENEDPVNIEPRILLVPTALEISAGDLFSAQEVRNPGATSKTTTNNPHRSKYQPVWSSYLGNANYTGNSDTAWYLLADPMELGVGVIEVVFLNGQQTPTIESSDLDFAQLGIQMRGYHDFGVSKQEYRCGVKSKGAA